MIILPILLFFGLSFVSLFVKSTILLSVLLFICVVINFIHSCLMISHGASLENFTYQFGSFAKGLGIEHTVDSFVIFISFILAFVVLVTSVQFIFALKDDSNDLPPSRHHYLFFLFGIMIAALNGIILTNDLFNLYIFLELASISAYIFTALNKISISKFAALYYLIIGGIASSLVLIGISLIYNFSGSINMITVNSIIKLEGLITPTMTESRYIIPFCFIVSGFAIKLGIFPFFRWVPLVYESLPPVIAPFYTSVFSKVLLSSFIIIMYRMFGISMLLNYGAILNILYFMLCAGIIIFSVKAMYETDIRKIFAYCGMTQLSYMLLGLLIFVPKAITGSLAHIMHDAIIKVGVMMMFWLNSRTHNSYEISSLKGFYLKNPVLAFCLIIFAASLIGIPGTSGFISKFYILSGCMESGSYIAFAVIIIGSILNAVYFWKMIKVIFFNPDSDLAQEEIIKPSNAYSKKTDLFLIQIIIICLAFLSALLGVYTKFNIGLASSVAKNLQNLIG